MGLDRDPDPIESTEEDQNNLVCQPTNAEKAGDLTGFDSKLRINQTFSQCVAIVHTDIARLLLLPQSNPCVVALMEKSD